MARVKDLWYSTSKEKTADGRVLARKKRTPRHPDNGGSKTAKRWLAIWVTPGGTEASRALATQDAAKKYGAKMEADADRGEYIAPHAGRELFGDLAAKFLRLRDVGASSREKYASTYRNQVESVFGHRAVKSVRPSEVLEWLRSPGTTRLSVSVQKTAYVIVCGVFDLAVADGLRRDNPARSPIIRPPSGEPSRRESWNAGQVWKVHDAHPEPYRAIVACSAALGLRQGQALALAEEDFDFGAEKVQVRRQVTRVGGRWVFKLPKEGRQWTVPLPRGLAAIVRSYIEAQPPAPYELPWMGEDGQLAGDPHVCRLLFRWHGDHPATHGKHIQASSFNISVWKPALARAGVIPPPPDGITASKYFERDCGGNGTHSLRHFYFICTASDPVRDVSSAA